MTDWLQCTVVPSRTLLPTRTVHVFSTWVPIPKTIRICSRAHWTRYEFGTPKWVTCCSGAVQCGCRIEQGQSTPVITLANPCINSMRPRQNGRRFADDLFKCIFLNENVRISIKISLKCLPRGPINNISALIQIMAWRRSGDKPLSEAMVFSLLTDIWVARPQWG